MNALEERMASEEVVKERKKKLEDLKTFLEEKQNVFSSIIQKLAWTPNHFLRRSYKKQCPHNANHMVPEPSFEKHVQICPLLGKGLEKKEAEEILDKTNYFYEKSNCVFPFSYDKEKMNEILWNFHVQNRTLFQGKKEVPISLEEEKMILSPAERGALHSHIIQQNHDSKKEDDEFLTMNLQELVKQNSDGKEERLKTDNYLELLKSQRDYKRRRQSYRAKNVHTTKKSYTEVIREVIENQTELLSWYVSQDNEKTNDEKTPPIKSQKWEVEETENHQVSSPMSSDLREKSTGSHDVTYKEDIDSVRKRDDRDGSSSYEYKRRRYSSSENDSDSSRKKKKSHKKHKHKNRS